MAKILLHTLGSSGDLNPFLALGLELKQRGHAVRFGLSPAQAQIAESLGMESAVIGHDIDPESPAYRKLLQPDLIGSVETLFRDILIPWIEPAADALSPLAADSDLFVSHIVQLAAPVIAHRTGVPWISATPTTNCYPTAHADALGVAWRNPPAIVTKLVWAVARSILRRVAAPIEEQYRRLGVPSLCDAGFPGAYSRLLTIGLWSPAFFNRPCDWPDWFQVGGYSRWDAPSAKAAVSAIPPGDGPLVVFTLGSSVVHDPRGYYEMALEAVRPTTWRAVLLGATDGFRVPECLASRVAAIRYAPYADLFPRASAIVHQGGVGTTQAACYYGVPAIVVPRGFDQYENAAHIQRNQLGLRIMPSSLSPTLLRIRLQRLLSSAALRQNTARLSYIMQGEVGVSRSADLVEMALEPGFRASRIGVCPAPTGHTPV